MAQIFFNTVDTESGTADLKETTEIAWVTLDELGHADGYKGVKFNPLLAIYKEAMVQPRGVYVTDSKGFNPDGKPNRQLCVVNTIEECIKSSK